MQLANDEAVFFLPKIFLATHILRVHFKVVHKLAQWVGLTFEEAGFSETLYPFFFYIIYCA